MLLCLFLAAGAGVWLLGGEDDEPESAPSAVSSVGADGEDESESAEDLESETEPGEEDGSESAARTREVQRAVRRYVAAIDGRDGALLCGLVDGVAGLDLPERRPSCAESVSESIGYRDPRGIPVFETATVAGAPEVQLDGDKARATVTVVTEFADRDEPSVEDDVVYLIRRDGVWVVAKPSSTIYRAIGVSDVPPDVLEPPE